MMLVGWSSFKCEKEEGILLIINISILSYNSEIRFSKKFVEV